MGTPSNAGASDDSRTTPGNIGTNGDYTEYLKLTNWSFSIPAGATIDGIEVFIEKRTETTAKTGDEHVYIVKGGTIGGSNSDDKANNTAWSTTDATETYGANNDLWSETWTASNINASDFGVAISVERTGGGGQTVTPEIDHVSITITYTPAALPIKLMSFTGKVVASRILLEWITAIELNNDYFSIERSSNGATFTEILELQGSGTTQLRKDYSAYDSDPVAATNYYRLKQTDFDGAFEYSDIIAVEFYPGVENCKIKVVPNPCPAMCHITFDGCEGEEFVNVGLYDLLGNQIMSSIPLTQGNGFYLDANNNMAPGTYVVMGTTSTSRVNKKFILQ